MASPMDRTYFPPLEDCLTGKNILLSWKLIASSLGDTSSDRIRSIAVSAFLQDVYVQQLIKNPSETFAAPSAQTKTDFETKTAAINVKPAPNERFDINIIKEDAQWLSRSLQINELAALRIVVVEFQSRPQSHLVGPLSSLDLSNIQEAAGVNDAQASNIVGPLTVSSIEDPETIWATFERESTRRQRLLSTYLSERRSFAGAANGFVSFVLMDSEPETGALQAVLAKDVFGLGGNDEINFGPIDATMKKYLAILPDCVQRAQIGPSNLRDLLTEMSEVDWIRTAMTEALHAMTLVFQVVALQGAYFASQDVVSTWFQFMAECAFMDQLSGEYEDILDVILPLKTLACAISLQLLQIPRSRRFLNQEVELLDMEEPYLTSSEILALIHNTLLAAANAGLKTPSPVIFAWTLILHPMYADYQARAERRDLALNQRAQDGFEFEDQEPGPRLRRNSDGSMISIEKSSYDLFLVSNALDRDMQVVESLAMAVTSGGLVYNWITQMSSCLGTGPQAAFRSQIGSRLRLVFIELLNASYPVVQYRLEPMSCLLSLLSGGKQYWDMWRDNSRGSDANVPVSMLETPGLRDTYLAQAQGWYPHDFLPFIRLYGILGASLGVDETLAGEITKYLVHTPRLALRWKGWNEIELTFEDENVDSFQLTGDIDLFAPPANARRRIAAAEEPQFLLPAGATGRFIPNEDARVALMDVEHSAVGLLGKRLQVNIMPEAYILGLDRLTPTETAEAIAFLATLLRAESLRGSPGGAGLDMLQEAGRYLPSTMDIIGVVCDTMDVALADMSEETLMLLTGCLQFLHATLAISPGRVWSYMARCELLNTEAKAGRLSKILGNCDLFTERFQFLSSAAKFLSSLIESVMTSAVQRKAAVTMANGRQRGGENSWVGASDKTLTRVSLSIAQVAVDIFENSVTWRFHNEVERCILTRDVVDIMQQLTSYIFSIGTLGTPNDLNACLVPASRYVVEAFLSTSSGSLRFQPLLQTLVNAFTIPDSTLYPRRWEIVTERLVSVLNFATILVKIASYLNQSSGVFQAQLFKVVSLVARLCGTRDAFKVPSISLLGALVESAGRHDPDNEPPSLLGHLGPHISRSFLQIMSGLDKPFNRPQAVVQIWKFFALTMRNRQQWMANCLLTGKTPREALRGEGSISQLSPDSVLSAAVDRLRSIATIPPKESLAILDFFNSAQNYWPWTIFAMQKDTAFLSDLRAYIRTLKSPTVTSKVDPDRAVDEVRMAAYIAETFSMQLYHLRQMRQQDNFAHDLVNDIDFFLRSGVLVAGYNNSLHTNFARNFSSRYPGRSLDEFKRTVLLQRDLGPQYFYAVDLAEAMLSFDGFWAGPRRNGGFRQEMITANLNLSLIDAEVALFHAWEYLLLEMSMSLLPQNGTIPRQMLQVAEQCLEANQRSQPPENIFVRLSHQRANLALSLLQRLADRSHLPSDTLTLLTNIFTAVKSVDDPFGAKQIPYFRTLLKILFVGLRGSIQGASKQQANGKNVPGVPNGNGKDNSVAMTQLVLDILDKVVARSFRTLVTMVHEADSPTTPQDFALITAILQACISMPGTDSCQPQILNILATHDVLQTATSLYSWADRLGNDNNGVNQGGMKVNQTASDPIYGELALLFLLELSAMPLIAEQLACNGLLDHLVSANLSRFMMRRPAGKPGASGSNNISAISPLAENPGMARCYGIWARGILPLLVNILGSLGPTIASEVAFVLKQFSNLVRASADRLEAPGLRTSAAAAAAGQSQQQQEQQQQQQQVITLVSVSEIHCLALLAQVLGAWRSGGSGGGGGIVTDGASSTGASVTGGSGSGSNGDRPGGASSMGGSRDIPEIEGWDGAAVLENVEFWLESRKVLRERLVALGPREMEWRATRIGGGDSAAAAAAGAAHALGCENKLEQKVVLMLEAVRDVLSQDEE